MRVRCSAMSPDISIRELGSVSVDEALEIFRRHPWSEELAEADQREQRLQDRTNPEIVFTAPSSHMIVRATSDGVFEVEVCLPRLRRLLGLFRWSKFCLFSELAGEAVEELIPAYFQVSLARRHERIGLLHDRFSLKRCAGTGPAQSP